MASFSDDFNRTDSTTIGLQWVEDSGQWTILSNGVEQETTTGVYRKLRWNQAFDTGDYYAQADLTVRTGTGCGVFIRGAASSTVTYYGYVFFTGDSSYIVEITGGSEGILATGGSVGAAGTGYTAARISATGSAITVTRNGVADTNTTDATLTGGHAGLASYDYSVNVVSWDNYAAADLTVSTRIRDMIGLDIMPKRR
jgi:hypothetical protein